MLREVLNLLFLGVFLFFNNALNANEDFWQSTLPYIHHDNKRLGDPIPLNAKKYEREKFDRNIQDRNKVDQNNVHNDSQFESGGANEQN